MMPGHSAEDMIIAIRNVSRTLAFAIGLLTLVGCGGATDKTDSANDGEHILSDQQKALESSKAAAEAMAEAAEERARQAEDARTE